MRLPLGLFVVTSVDHVFGAGGTLVRKCDLSPRPCDEEGRVADTDDTGAPTWPSEDADAGGEPGGQAAPGVGPTAYLKPVTEVTRSEQPTAWVQQPPPPRPPRPAPQEQPTQPTPQPPPDRSAEVTQVLPVQPPRPPQPARPAPPVQQAAPARPMRIEPTGQVRPAPPPVGNAHQPHPPHQANQPYQPNQPYPPHQTNSADEAARPAEPQAAEPRRRGPLLVGGALALVVLVAVGVVLALPDVSNRLGLPWAPNLPTAEPPQPVAVSRDLHGPNPSAPTPTPGGVAEALRGPASARVLGTLTGTVVDPATGKALWNQGADRPLTPASTTKLLVAAAALLSLDHDTRIPTKIVEGDRPGSVVLVAGGDVTLSSLPVGQESFYPGAAHLDELVSQVKKATGGNVDEVSLDLGVYSGDTTAAGWAPEDVPSTYGVAVVPAMLDGGSTSPTDFGAMRVANPAGVLVRELAGRLGASVGNPSTTTAAKGARVLGTVRSAPIVELVDTMLRNSDNLLAEAIARQVALANGQPASFEGAARATLNVLSRNGFDVSDVRLSDGSGLSTRNKVPAQALADLLAVAAAPDGNDPRTAKMRPMLAGLPVAGGTGTLTERYTGGSADAARGWARAKTGTLSGVNTLAGVVLDADGRMLAFALMSAGGQTEPARAALDDIVAALRACGCR